VSEALEFVVRAVLIGVGATAVLALWAVLATRLIGFPAPNWGLVGRWVGHFPRRQFVHDNIAEAAPVGGELMIGWATHYVTGVVYAALLLAVWGLGWARHPTLLPAFIVSLLALAAPFFIMQPAMGAGIAGSKTPRPNAARLRSVAGHTAFGIGLYGAAMLSALLTLP
jgi:hypothetical protein